MQMQHERHYVKQKVSDFTFLFSAPPQLHRATLIGCIELQLMSNTPIVSGQFLPSDRLGGFSGNLFENSHNMWPKNYTVHLKIVTVDL